MFLNYEVFFLYLPANDEFLLLLVAVEVVRIGLVVLDPVGAVVDVVEVPRRGEQGAESGLGDLEEELKRNRIRIKSGNSFFYSPQNSSWSEKSFVF